MSWISLLAGKKSYLKARRVSQRRDLHRNDVEPLEIRVLLSGSGVFVDTGQSIGQEASSTSYLPPADFDGDGDLDVIAGGIFSANDGTGHFENQAAVETGAFVGGDVGDLDGDGDIDLFLPGYLGDKANQVWLNRGDGTFVDSGQRLGTDFSWSVKLADLDSDGDLDAFVVNTLFVESSVIWLNSGDGTFTEGQRLDEGGTSVAIGDIDGDGDFDAVVADYRSADRLRVWINDGAASFSLSQQNLLIQNAQDVELGDIDGDGDLDAVVPTWSESSGDVVLFNNGLGEFPNVGRIPNSGTRAASGLGDIDGDGDLDVAFARRGLRGTPNILMRNDGSGGFSESQILEYDLNGGTQQFTFGDFDSDGDLDLLVHSHQLINLWLNLDQDDEFASLSVDVALPDDGGAFQLARDVADVVLTDQDGVELYRAPHIDSPQLVIRGSSAADTLTVDFSGGNPIRDRGIIFDGSVGDDRVVLMGGSAASVTQDFTTSNDGHVTVDGRDVILRGIESISDELAVSQRVYQFGSNSDFVTLADNDSVSDGVSRLSLLRGVTTDFSNPTGSLRMMAGNGSDTVTLAGADALLAVPVEVFGEDGNDVLIGSMAGDSLDGGEGDDSLNGRGGNDSLIGGDGRDELMAGSGHDSLMGGGDNDRINGQSGHDTLIGGSGQDTLMGGNGHDLVRGGADDDILNGQSGHDTLSGGNGRDTLMGGSGHDSLSGEDDADKLIGHGGNDTLNGGVGDDLLSGRNGRDLIVGGDGADTLIGGDGHDTLSGDAGRDALSGGRGKDQINGGADSDWMQGEEGNDSLIGLAGDDVMYGGTGRDTLLGGDGADKMRGGSNFDVLLGGLGDDTLDGGRGQDTLAGNEGDDIITGLPSEIDDAFTM